MALSPQSDSSCSNAPDTASPPSNTQYAVFRKAFYIPSEFQSTEQEFVDLAEFRYSTLQLPQAFEFIKTKLNSLGTFHHQLFLIVLNQ